MFNYFYSILIYNNQLYKTHNYMKNHVTVSFFFFLFTKNRGAQNNNGKILLLKTIQYLD